MTLNVWLLNAWLLMITVAERISLRAWTAKANESSEYLNVNRSSIRTV